MVGVQIRNVGNTRKSPCYYNNHRVLTCARHTFARRATEYTRLVGVITNSWSSVRLAPSRVVRRQLHWHKLTHYWYTTHGVGPTSTTNRFAIYDLSLANKTSVQDPSLILEPVLLSGGNCGDLDDSRPKTIVTRLCSMVRTGAAIGSCISLV